MEVNIDPENIYTRVIDSKGRISISSSNLEGKKVSIAILKEGENVE